MRFLDYLRLVTWGRNSRLGFPVLLPLVLGVALFWAGHYLAGEKPHLQHRTPVPVHTVSWKLVAA